MEAYGAFGEEAGDRIVAGEGLQPTATATTVRVRDGERLLTDGPFAETKEQLGGFYLVDCDDLDEALALGGQDPGRRDRLRGGAPGHGLRVARRARRAGRAPGSRLVGRRRRRSSACSGASRDGRSPP